MGRATRGRPLLALAGMLAAGGTQAAAPVVDAGGAAAGDLAARLARVERVLDSRGLVELAAEVQALREELRRLRGEVEEQRHAIAELRQQQARWYRELDARIARLPGPAGTAPVPAPAAATAAGPAAPVPPAAAAPSPGPSPTPAPDLEATEREYQHALGLLRSGEYAAAVEALKAFIARHPDGELADDAQFWLGEAYYVQRQFEPALAAYRELLERWPDSGKRAQAELKAAFCLDELGRDEEAMAQLEALQRSAPGTTAARLAAERLQRLRLAAGGEPAAGPNTAAPQPPAEPPGSAR